MCLVVLGHQLMESSPVLLAANREELFARRGLPPRLEPGPPRVFCGRDPAAGGTWLGVNEFGLVVAVTNRHDRPPPPSPRSRGLLCRDLLNLPRAEDAADAALAELERAPYAGVNVLAADADGAWVVHAGRSLHRARLAPGLHVLTNGDVDDDRDARCALARDRLGERFRDEEEFLARAAEVCRTGPDESGRTTIVLRGPDRGTVSSTLLALGPEERRRRWLYADGPPDVAEYADLSDELRRCLEEGRRAAAPVRR